MMNEHLSEETKGRLRIFNNTFHYAVCQHCNGFGEVEDIESKYLSYKKCKWCDGSGVVLIYEPKHRFEISSQISDEELNKILDSAEKIEKIYFKEIRKQ